MKKQAFNPYLPGCEYIPDGEPYVFGDRVYVYGSHDRFDGDAYCENDYVCWSAPVDDLGDWKYEGVIYKKSDDPMNPDGSHRLYAPDLQRGPDGRYYLYYAFDYMSAMSVAVCDTPAGKFEYYGSVKTPDGHIVGLGEGDIFQFDPGVFVDDDGRVYLFSGFAPKYPRREGFDRRGLKTGGGYFFELEQDMLTVKRGPILLFPREGESAGTGYEGHEFFEASSLRKVGEKYYFVYSSINSHELCYAVSDRPDGGYVYGGTLVSNADIFLRGETDGWNYPGNTHGSIIEIAGQWYVFYHRQTNLHVYSRQACAEPITIAPDGSIEQAEMTSCGLNGGPLAGRGEYEARIACNLRSREGVALFFTKAPVGIHPYFTQDEPDGDCGTQYIANLTDGATAGFKYFMLDGATSIGVKIRGGAKGTVTVSVSPGGNPAAEIAIAPSEEWAEFSAPLSAPDGKQALFFTFRGDGAFDFMSFTLG